MDNIHTNVIITINFCILPCRPGLISALDTFSITAVACGNVHSVAIDDDGTLFTWGDNSYGQLGSDTQTDNKFFPM